MSELKKIRTDVVGSLLRPAAVKEARTRFDDGKIDADEFARDRGRSGARGGEVAGSASGST